MTRKKRILTSVYWGVTWLALAAAICLSVCFAPSARDNPPADVRLGVVGSIFYLHVPVALNTYIAAAVVFVASAGYLWTRRRWWDDLANAAARVTFLSCTVVLITGAIWAHAAWGLWWTWSPRLTLSLVLWILYAAYLVLRPLVPDQERRAGVCAVYGTAAFLDVPLVYMSVKLFPDIHPSSLTSAGQNAWTFLLWMVAITMISLGIMAQRFSLARRLSLEERRTSSRSLTRVIQTGHP